MLNKDWLPRFVFPLPYDNVINPNEITVIDMVNDTVGVGSGEHSMLFFLEGTRCDYPTRLPDRNRMPIYENDILSHPVNGDGVVFFLGGQFYVQWDSGNAVPLEFVHGSLTKTGIEPYKEADHARP